MKRASLHVPPLLLPTLLGLALLGCARPQPKVWVPPRIDLHRYGTLGLVEFQSTDGYGPLATRQFVSALHDAQAGVPVLELGPLDRVLRDVGHDAVGPDAARAIGARYEVDVVVFGELAVEAPRPRFSITSLTQASASADILGTLHARLLDAGSGATIWSDQARGKRSVAHLGVVAGERPHVDAVDPEDERARLVSWLVANVTHDFRGAWTRP